MPKHQDPIGRTTDIEMSPLRAMYESRIFKNQRRLYCRSRNIILNLRPEVSSEDLTITACQRGFYTYTVGIRGYQDVNGDVRAYDPKLNLKPFESFLMFTRLEMNNLCLNLDKKITVADQVGLKNLDYFLNVSDMNCKIKHTRKLLGRGVHVYEISHEPLVPPPPVVNNDHWVVISLSHLACRIASSLYLPRLKATRSARLPIQSIKNEIDHAMKNGLASRIPKDLYSAIMPLFKNIDEFAELPAINMKGSLGEVLNRQQWLGKPCANVGFADKGLWSENRPFPMGLWGILALGRWRGTGTVREGDETKAKKGKATAKYDEPQTQRVAYPTKWRAVDRTFWKDIFSLADEKVQERLKAKRDLVNKAFKLSLVMAVIWPNDGWEDHMHGRPDPKLLDILPTLLKYDISFGMNVDSMYSGEKVDFVRGDTWPEDLPRRTPLGSREDESEGYTDDSDVGI
ncbi:hypothetical protein BDY21DRAFT_382254 [Lineolata rhizophorae]|uniref:Uncharacterized protein n=1 Tax=Lineolata rhizophorae TaxID=578093 RepID=A0A6A6NPY4_9PEZI|nr:hypothetical protein BDY21DRAFT_382254 [Lineolata rhizophorae]